MHIFLCYSVLIISAFYKWRLLSLARDIVIL